MGPDPDDESPRKDAEESVESADGESGTRESEAEPAPPEEPEDGSADERDEEAATADSEREDSADSEPDDSEETDDETGSEDSETAEETDEQVESGDSDDGDAPDGSDDGDATDGSDDEPEPIDDGVPDWDVGRNRDDEADEDAGGFEIPSDVDIREGYDDYEDRVDFDDDSSERTTEVDLSDEDVETVSDPDATAFERKAASGPTTDEEQPLAVHIEEMVKRLGIVIAIAGAVSLAAFPFAEDVVIFLWYSILPSDVSQPHVYHPLELVLTQLKTASLAGLVIALPAFVYETYAFMRPGLYPHERRYYLAAVPTSLVLALVGVSFAYFIVLPAVMNYFLYYSESVVEIAFALGATFNLFLILMGYLALVFQIPLFIMLAIMMGLTTREWMEDRRIIFWGVFLGLSFLFSPDPTGMAPLIVAATMVALFEGTLLVLRWANRG